MNKEKQKAKELIDKYYPLCTVQYSTPPFEIIKSQTKNRAKECALICCQEIISANPHSNPLNTNSESTMDYWQKVKQAITDL